MPNADEFLNPKSMLTPGIAGSVAMLIANSLFTAFGWPQSITALILSFVCALLAWGKSDAPKLQRSALYVLNSLIIFSVAMGTNTAGMSIAGGNQATETESYTAFVAPSRDPLVFNNRTERRVPLDETPTDLRSELDRVRRSLGPGEEREVVVSGERFRVSRLPQPMTRALIRNFSELGAQPQDSIQAVQITRIEDSRFFRSWF
jgi:hypothetical protein